MDRCVMRKMAYAKTHSFFTLLFYSHHRSPCVSVRLVIWIGIQWTTLIITEEDERGINNSTEARAKRKRATGRERDIRERGERRESFEDRQLEKRKQTEQSETEKTKKKGRIWQARRQRRSIGRDRHFFEGLWVRGGMWLLHRSSWQENCRSREKIHSQGVKIHAPAKGKLSTSNSRSLINEVK